MNSLEQIPPPFIQDNNPPDMVHNMKVHDTLIVASLRLRDLAFLQKWGVDYPKQQGYNWVVEPQVNADYMRALSQLKAATSMRQSGKNHYDLLIEGLTLPQA